jgi:hypothetical protein
VKSVRAILVVLLAAAATAGTAWAQAPGSAQAEELFKEGRAALQAKDWVVACAKLAESNRIERAVGTLISLAQCEEAQNKLATARQHYQEAADLADALNDRLQRGPMARERVAELDKRVARLTVKAGPNAPPNTVVKQDDVGLTWASFGSSLPVDPGKHVLVVTADAHEPRTIEVVLGEGENLVVEVEPGERIATVADARAPSPEQPPPPPASPARVHSSARTLAFVAGGAALVGIGLGTGFGLRAFSKWSSAQSACKHDECGPGSHAQEEKTQASSAASISTIAFVAAGVALAAGLVLYMVNPASPKRDVGSF